jgi:hypothetical protein
VAAATAAAAPDEDGTVAAAAGKQPQKSKNGKKKKKPGHSRSRADYQSRLCYFHVWYGDKALRCEEPCAWPAGN